MIILVCGGRNFDDWGLLNSELSKLEWNVGGIDAIVHGDANGVDAMAGKWAREHGIPEIRVPAQWDYYGNSAGPLRNQWMADIIKPDLVLAFPGGKGTANMKEVARKNNIELLEV